MTRLYLLRHAETSSNVAQIYQGQGNSSLTQKGRSEANKLAKSLIDIHFTAVYSSTLERSRETAQIIAESHGLDVVQIEGLKERNYGNWEGLNFKEISQKFPDIYHDWLLYPAKAIIPGGETLAEVQKRGVRAIDAILQNHPGETIAVVGHGGINRTILFHYMNLELDNFWRIKQHNCCVNIIEFGDHPAITLLNGTWFLKEEVETEGYY